MKQMNLFPKPDPSPKKDWRHVENQHAVRYAGRRPYKPGTAKRVILAMLDHEEWTGFLSIMDELNMSVRLVSDLLYKLEYMGLIEITPLYYKEGDRTIKPPVEYYRGFENGYRLAANVAAN